jgi:hypothetical protein
MVFVSYLAQASNNHVLAVEESVVRKEDELCLVREQVLVDSNILVLVVEGVLVILLYES